jgi:hypothetical protein
LPQNGEDSGGTLPNVQPVAGAAGKEPFAPTVCLNLSPKVAWVEFVDAIGFWPGVTLNEVEVGKTYERLIGMGREPHKIDSAWVVKEPISAVALASGTKVEYVPFTAIRRFRLI